MRPPRKHFSTAQDAIEFYKYRIRYAKFMCRLYHIWIQSNDTSIEIRELASMLTNLLGGIPSVCVDNGPCVGKQFGIDVSGIIAHCDKFFSDQQFCFGCLPAASVTHVMAMEEFARAKETELTIRSKCSGCDWFRVCKGGFLNDAVLFNNSGLADRREYCHVKIMYDYIWGDLQKGIEHLN